MFIVDYWIALYVYFMQMNFLHIIVVSSSGFFLSLPCFICSAVMKSNTCFSLHYYLLMALITDFISLNGYDVNSELILVRAILSTLKFDMINYDNLTLYMGLKIVFFINNLKILILIHFIILFLVCLVNAFYLIAQNYSIVFATL